MRHPAVVLALSLLAVSGTAHANGVLPDTTSAPLAIDVEAAVAATPHGSTRWSRVTVDGSARAMWLVPVRPGAAVDWASDAWLAALDDATAVRVVQPALPRPCTAPLPTHSERAPAWTRTGTKRWPSAMTIQNTESSLRAHAGQRGFAIRADLGSRLASLYARGWSIVTFELEPTATQRMTSPTIRVSDDGAAELPFALVNTGATPTRLSAFTITRGPATVAGAGELSPATISWGAEGSSYARRRGVALYPDTWVRASTWLRESSSHEVLFEGVAIPDESDGVAPLTRTYFASAGMGAQCEGAARTAGSGSGTLGRVCAAGAVARIAGGSECAASNGTVDSHAFICGNSGDDLALALSGNAPREMFVTRFVGQLPATTSGVDDALSPFAAPRSPVMTAGAYERCPAPADETPLTPPPPRGAMPIPVNGPSYDDSAAYTSSEGCSGSASSDYYEEDTSEGCSVDSGDGDDGSDDSSGDDSSWEDDSSSDDSESEDDSSDSSDSDDDSEEIQIEWGDDDSEEESWQSKAGPRARPHGIKKPSLHERSKKPVQTTRRLRKRESSPVSRMALFFGALVLPFRRRKRFDVE
ncbi:MAG: Endo,4-beta-xylanase precursor [Labilithrix sp.]|nr:Endo,4-beta-xylanase precursor [Labilithrix sp.]